MSKFNFKPFDKVLVRDDDGDTWGIEFFEREDKDVGSYPYACMNCDYVECIPYNEETKHLLGTNKPYTTKEDEATKYTPGKLWKFGFQGVSGKMLYIWSLKNGVTLRGVRMKFMVKGSEYVPNLLMKYGKR